MVNCAECENSKCKRIEELACAIVIQAVKDYRDARTTLAKKPKDKKTIKKCRKMIDECETFFLSEWFVQLTSIDGKMLLGKLRGEFS